MPFQKRVSRGALAVLLACAWHVKAVAEQADALVALSFESLLETDVAGAAGFVREVTDAPSAVSVVTSEEIRQFGYRTLGEILNSMRGVHVSFDGDNDNLSGRGYGNNSGEYAGRIALFVDGYPVADPRLYRLFLGDDGMLDPSVIDRVEYAPGPGAAVYGNNAFLGVFNVITRKGRDLDGAHIAYTRGSHGDRKKRLNWGKRLENGADVLLSLSTHSVSLPGYMRVNDKVAPQSEDEHLFLKIRKKGWWLEAARANRQQRHVATTSTWNTQDLNRFLQLGYDTDWDDLKASFKLYKGLFSFGVGDRSYSGPGADLLWTSAALGGQAQLAGTVSDKHRWTLGAEYRKEHDIAFEQQIDFGFGNLHQVSQGDDVQFRTIYAQDEIRLHPNVDLNLGLRHEQRRLAGQSTDVLNPRVGMVYRLTPDTQLKWSHGTASRWMGSADRQNGFDTAERVRTTEVSAESRWPYKGLRLVSSLYRYRIDPRKETVQAPNLTYVATQGAELELEWRWQEVLVRASHAVQLSHEDRGVPLKNVPRSVSKLQVSAPLGNDRWRASVALRAVGWDEGGYVPGTNIRAKSYATTDVTLLGRDVVKGLDLTFAIRDLFDQQSGVERRVSNTGAPLPWGGRTYWLQLEYRFR